MTDDMFFDAIHEMPDVEADYEIRLRRDAVLLENNMLKLEKDRASGREAHEIGVVINRNNFLLSKLNHELHIISQRNSSNAWRRAVKAVCGEEAYVEVVMWIELEAVKLGKQGA
jgi:hypothetical protein